MASNLTSSYNTQQTDINQARHNQYDNKINRINMRSRSNSSYGRGDTNRPKSSTSVTRTNNITQTQEESKNPNNKNDTMNQTGEKVKETIIIELSDQLFNNLSWAYAFDFVNQEGKAKEILGLIPVRSNLVWRYFLSLLKQRQNIKQHREKRTQELKVLIEKLEKQMTEEGKAKKHQQIQEIYDKLKNVQSNGNPLTNMMARNLKVFLKIYAEVKRKTRLELESFTQAILMDKKIEDIEKQNLENRILVLGAYRPNQFFNTHPRVYDKVQINQNF